MDWIVGGLAATTRERAVPQTDRRRPLRQSPAVPGGRPKAACQALSLLGGASLGSFAVWSGRHRSDLRQTCRICQDPTEPRFPRT
jgi:hypothetical protein